ncbi:MAG TPA: polysaccharide deacetylase family protein [Actinomycetota bacterium]|nr:polysaccharide deacetylase family protein [Actinomycetota bacterium]
MKRRVFLGGGVAAVAGLAGGPALLDRRGERQVRELNASAVPAVAGRRLGQQRLIWSVSTVKPLAALTFDDGPDPELTPRILEVLAEHGVQATFNMMGWNALRHPDLVRELVAAGHELGNHTWTHQDLAFQSALQTRRQLERGREAIERTAGVRPRFFRPPRGNLTGSAIQSAAELGYDVLLWSVTRGASGVGTPAAVADHLAGTVGPGDVVALHDGIGRGTFHPREPGAHQLRARRLVEVQALPAAVERLLGRGLRLVTASTLLAAGTQHRAYTLTNSRRP